MLNIYIAAYLTDIAALLFLCVLINNNNMLNENRKKPFMFCIILTAVIIIAEAGTVLAADTAYNLRFINILCNVLGFALSPLIPVVLISIFDMKLLKAHKLFAIPSIINIIATVLSPRLGLIFYVDINNFYTRGYAFSIFVAAYILNIAFLLLSTLAASHNYHYSVKSKFIALSLFAVIGTSVQLFSPAFYSTWHCVTLSLLLYYLLMAEFDGSFDTLTGLHNRAAYEKMIKKLPGNKAFSVIVMDINDFKIINDNYGHEFGDSVLKTIAQIITKAFDKHCSCYRVGGDEFYIICKETDPETLEQRLKNMTDNLAKARVAESRIPAVSYGYSIYLGDEPLDFQKILNKADRQMYHYKRIQKKKN